MAYTKIQKLRRMRAKNKGMNISLVANLRRVATMLEKKGPAEFSRKEIVALQGLREMLNVRLYTNALTESTQVVFDGNCKIVAGKYIVDLNPKDL